MVEVLSDHGWESATGGCRWTAAGEGAGTQVAAGSEKISAPKSKLRIDGSLKRNTTAGSAWPGARPPSRLVGMVMTGAPLESIVTDRDTTCPLIVIVADWSVTPAVRLVSITR